MSLLTRLACFNSDDAPHRKKLLRCRKVRLSEGLPDHAVRIEVDLPVVVIVDIWPHSQHRPCQIELEDLHVRGRVFQDIGDHCKMLPQHSDGISVVYPMIQLGLEIDAPVRIRGEILDIA